MGYTYNVDTENFTAGLLDLLELTVKKLMACSRYHKQWDAPKEVPETTLRDYVVGRKDTHAVDFGSGIILSGQMAADDLELLERHLRA